MCFRHSSACEHQCHEAACHQNLEHWGEKSWLMIIWMVPFTHHQQVYGQVTIGRNELSAKRSVNLTGVQSTTHFAPENPSMIWESYLRPQVHTVLQLTPIGDGCPCSTADCSDKAKERNMVQDGAADEIRLDACFHSLAKLSRAGGATSRVSTLLLVRSVEGPSEW